MRLTLSLVLFVVLVPVSASAASGDDTPDAAQTVVNLRLQLIEVQAKETELQARAQQLDEDLNPENIERSLAGIGSTKPEELREMRRRQLTIEREGVRAQLKLLATSRERLESVIRTAETRAYQQSAEGTTPPLNQTLARRPVTAFSWRTAAMIISLIVAVGIAAVLVLGRRTGIRVHHQQ
jgi:hypothetical protein